MKKTIFLLFILICFLATFGLVNAADDNPLRNATKVNDVFKPYTSDDWVVSPDDEPFMYQKVDNAPECDLKGVISCYDDTYLRVDILLQSSISFKWDILYGIRLEYSDMNEYYIYHTDSKKFTYKKEKNGKIVEIKDLANDSAGDVAGITDSGDLKNSDVYFIINKSKHIDGEKGKKYILTGYFYSGYINKKGETKVADETADVDLEFEY